MKWMHDLDAQMEFRFESLEWQIAFGKFIRSFALKMFAQWGVAPYLHKTTTVSWNIEQNTLSFAWSTKDPLFVAPEDVTDDFDIPDGLEAYFDAVEHQDELVIIFSFTPMYGDDDFSKTEVVVFAEYNDGTTSAKFNTVDRPMLVNDFGPGVPNIGVIPTLLPNLCRDIHKTDFENEDHEVAHHLARENNLSVKALKRSVANKIARVARLIPKFGE